MIQSSNDTFESTIPVFTDEDNYFQFKLANSLLNIKEVHSLPGVIVPSISREFKSVIKYSTDRLKLRFLNGLQEMNIDYKNSHILKSIFDNDENNLITLELESLNTDYKLKECANNYLKLTSPISYKFDIHSDNKFYYVPITEQLINLINNDQIRSLFLDATKNNGNLIRNFFDNSKFKSATDCHVAIYIQLYLIEFEPCNPTGQIEAIIKLHVYILVS